MKYVAGNAQHIGDRHEQQDAFGFSNPGNKAFLRHGGLLGVLADGMGGMALGSETSKIAVRTFLNSYAGKSPGQSIPGALKRALAEANEAVLSLAGHNGLEDEVGTTLAAAVIHNNSLHWISAGDSRVYLLREGRLIQLTTDHVYANKLAVEAASGKISRIEALNDPSRDDLTSYLGLPEIDEIDQNNKPFILKPGDRVLLCSDGLYKGLSEEEIAASLKASPHSACDQLVEQVLSKQRPHQDNVTAIALARNEGESDARSKRRASKLLLMIIAALLFAAAGPKVYRWIKAEPVKQEQQENSNQGESGSTEANSNRSSQGPPETGNSNQQPAKEKRRKKEPRTPRPRSNKKPGIGDAGGAGRATQAL